MIGKIREGSISIIFEERVKSDYSTSGKPQPVSTHYKWIPDEAKYDWNLYDHFSEITFSSFLNKFWDSNNNSWTDFCRDYNWRVCFKCYIFNKIWSISLK